MKRRLFIKSGSAVVAAALSGCGGGGGGSAEPSAVADAAAIPGPTVPVQSSEALVQSAPATPASPPTQSTAAPAPAEPPAPSAASRPFNVGVNIHIGGTSSSQNAQIAAILQARKFKRIRMDYYWDQNQTLPRELISQIRAYGGSVEMALQIPYQWDSTIYTGSQLATIEKNAYDQTYKAVDAMKDLVHDFELLNEVTYRPEMMAQVAPGNGQLESAYNGKTAFLSIAAVLRGMANAIHDLAASSGLPLRVILGTVNRDWGFLGFMRTQGVKFDVVGWHVYPSEGSPDLQTDTWYGPGGPLAQLAAFGKPVTINEFNAGETYTGGYENAEGQPVTEQGFRSNVKHMLELCSQTECKLESVVFYELLDEPSKSAPENRFGLMSNLTAPKVSLHVATAFAGGALSLAERAAITSRGLLTNAQIDAML